MNQTHRMTHARRLIVICIGAVATMNGLPEPTFGSRLQDVRQILALPLPTTGVVLGAFTFGLLIGGTIASVTVDRIGTRILGLFGAVMYWGGLAAIACLLLLPHDGSSVYLLGLLWGIAGLGNGVLDSFQTIQATTASGGRPSLALAFQAAQGVGTLLGAMLGSYALAVGFPVAGHFLIVGVPALVVGVIAAAILPNRPVSEGDRIVPDDTTGGEAAEDIGVPGLLSLGLMMAASVIPLGLSLNWATSVLAQLSAPPALLGSALIGFTGAQVLAMVGASRLPFRPERIARVGVSLSLVGVSLLVAVALQEARPLLPTTVEVWVTTASFLLLGLGIAPIPAYVQQSAANIRVGKFKIGMRTGVVTIIQYAGAWGSPVLLGLLAVATGVTLGFALITAVCVVMLLVFHGALRHAQVRKAA